MEIIGTIISAQNEPNKSGEGESFTVRFRDTNGKEWVPLKAFHDSMKDEASALKGVVSGAKITIEKPEGKRFWDLISIEATTAEESHAPAVAPNGYSNDTNERCAALIMKDLRIAGCVDDDNKLYQAMKIWVANQLNAWPDKKETPTYKDAKGNDPSKVTAKDIEKLKEKLGIDPATIAGNDELEQQITLRFGFDAKMSDEECKDWIKELKTQIPPF